MRILTFLLLCALPLRAEERVIAFGDVHGAYDELTPLLRSAGVVDAGLRWAAGKSRVVSTGDLLDRGPGSRKAMDLLMRLQGEATAAGGSLQVLLGNHEAMNLMGDLHDTTPAELESYGGLAGHRAEFAPGGTYGRWLLGLPVAVTIGDTLFMHGGPSQVVAGLSVAEINNRYRSALSAYLSALDAVLAAGLVRLEDPFEDRVALARKRADAEHAGLARKLAAADGDPMLDVDGPNWYRGAALCNEVAESDVLKPILEKLGVKRLVIGHSVTRDRRVVSRFGGSVIKLDTGMNRAVFRGHPAALVLEDGAPRVIYAEESGAPAAVPAEPLYVASPMPDDMVSTVLSTGKVTMSGGRDAVVDLEGKSVPAVLITDGAKKELAAYRVDRALRLGLVPVTVEREVNGKRGVLQARPPRFVSQAEVAARKLQAGGWCALPPQFELMYAFDALIGNEERTPERILYDSDWMLLLTGHERAFGTGKGLPRNVPAHPGPELRRRLAALDTTPLGLSDSERSALLARRDALLKRSGP